MTTTCYILDADGEPVPCISMLEWARWFETTERHVARDTVNGFFVSTVFLGLDHSYGSGPPVLWETMVFTQDGGADCVYQQRYRSRAAALDGHASAVALAASLGEQPHA